MVTLCLKSKVEIYVPSTKKVSEITDTSSFVEQTARYFSEWFGGATMTENEGYYLAENGQLVVEPVFIVWAYCLTEELEKYTPQVIEWAETICQELQQESVAVVINGQMLFAKAK